MLPDNQISSEPIAASFYTPIRQSVFFDYELGGSDFQDNSTGLDSHLWKCRYTRDGQIRVYNNIVSHDVLTLLNVTEIAFAFDINMQPVIAYNQNAVTHLYFFDSIAAQFTTIVLGKLEHPRLSLDTRVISQTDIADVILAYTRNGILCIRYQRERYGAEHQLGISPGRLWHCGMMKNYRFGFVFRPEQ
jgi:hypothetical protein